MANLSITTRCNRACGYCFARDAPVSTRAIPAGRFDRILELLGRSGIDEVRLLGGEPTLHPDFTALVGKALSRGFRVRVFSNGIMDDRTLAELACPQPEQVTFLVNAGEDDPGLWAVQQRTLRHLGCRASLGFNVHSPWFEPGFLLDWIEEFGLSRSIRFGLAHPVAGGTNAYLHPRGYRAAARRLSEFAERAAARGVRVTLDCGFVPCMFPEAGLAVLGESGAAVGTSCGAIPDILPDGRAVPCYPLARVASRPRVEEAVDLRSVRARLDDEVEPLRSVGIFRECGSCGLRRSGACNGGCVSAGMLRLRPAAPLVREPAMSAERRPFPSAQGVPIPGEGPRSGPSGGDPAPRRTWVVPYIDQPLEFWQRLGSDFGGQIEEVYFPLPPEVMGSGRPPQPSRFLEEFLRGAPLGRSVLLNPITLPRQVDALTPAVIEVLRKLAGDYGISSATVSNLLLARRIREAMPSLRLAASVLADIARPNEALIAAEVCDTVVAASRIVRDLVSLRALRAAFPGRVRLIVNEGCLPGCPYRVQHFHEMGSGIALPQSLCHGLLSREPWLRLTGAWILPQHLHLYDGLYDELKLAGRVTLKDPAMYRRVLGAYVRRESLAPDEIGGGPASVLERIEITEAFFAASLRCGHRCHECSLCREYWSAEAESKLARPGPL